MNASNLIQKKRDGQPLEADEIAALVGGYVRGDVPDYQMAALAMAIFFRGMDASETAALTSQMLRSGTMLQWSCPSTPKVDKHSTGGIGDKVSLVLAPLVACCGLQLPMISGRGLGATGGTIDKLESIPGFRTDLSIREIQETTERVGCVITAATSDLALADRKLYALRDVTASVESVPLITASILSKKLAENLNALVLDVKFGTGAFMKTRDKARELARSMVETATRMGVKTTALLTDMNQPLGRLAGHAVEVDEALSALVGDGPADLEDVVMALGSELLVMAGVAATPEDAVRQLRHQIDSGNALEKFREMVTAQGGNLDAHRPVAPPSVVRSSASGFVSSIDGEKLGRAIIELGGGRRKMGDRIDHAVGLEMLVRLGEAVENGQPLVTIFASAQRAARAMNLIGDSIVVDSQPPPPVTLIAERLV